MISISGTEDTGYEVTLKMGTNSDPVELALDYPSVETDIYRRDFTLKIDGSGFCLPVEDGVAKIKPESISLATGIYPFAVLMDGKSIMNGYLEWQGDDS